MYLDVVDLRDFYSGDLGVTVRAVLSDVVRSRWPATGGDRILGLGFTSPYLGQFSREAERVLAFSPATQGAVNWPAPGPSSSALVVEDMLPLSDAAVDRVLLVHALEMAGDPREILRESGACSPPAGACSRSCRTGAGSGPGWTARPSAMAAPLSRGQLVQLLRESLFSPIGWGEALHMMPLKRRRWRRVSSAWEQVGSRLWPAFAGVIVVERPSSSIRAFPWPAAPG